MYKGIDLYSSVCCERYYFHFVYFDIYDANTTILILVRYGDLGLTIINEKMHNFALPGDLSSLALIFL